MPPILIIALIFIAPSSANADENAAKIIYFINGAQGDGSFFDSAARGLAEGSEEELHVLVRLNLADLLTEFMERAGYALADGSSGKVTFNGPADTRLDFRIFTSIQEVELVKQFKNPRMAMMIKTSWGRRME